MGNTGPKEKGSKFAGSVVGCAIQVVERKYFQREVNMNAVVGKAHDHLHGVTITIGTPDCRKGKRSMYVP